ncbi:MAG: DUF2617 family protein [Phycisphaerae bacterium]|nr:DUF2617 family protein [Phycisphaerae bacterium]
MELGQTLQRVGDMQFFLYRRALHPELFHIHQERRIESRRYHANLWIVGLTHAVTVQADDRIITELTADDHELLPEAGRVTTFRFRGERDHTERFDDGMRYILSTQVEKLSPNLFNATHRDLVRYGANRGMFLAFQEWTDNGPEPFTFLDYEVRDKELHIQSFHAFPADHTILKTQSIFEIGPRPKSKDASKSKDAPKS